MEFKREVLKDTVVITVDPTDRAGSAGIGELKNLMLRFVGQGERKFLIDLTGIDFIESRGIGALVGCVRLLAEKTGLMIVMGLKPQIVRVLELMRLTKVIPIRMDRDESLELLRKTVPKPDSLERFVNDNPSLEAVTTYWASRAPAAPSTEAQQKLVEPAPAPAPPPPASVVPTDGSDWSLALELFVDARQLAKKNGIEFTTDTTFAELFRKIAEKTVAT